MYSYFIIMRQIFRSGNELIRRARSSDSCVAVVFTQGRRVLSFVRRDTRVGTGNVRSAYSVITSRNALATGAGDSARTLHRVH